MEKMKVMLVMGIVISILVFCAFAPGICIDRFMLPDGCGKGCAAIVSPCRASSAFAETSIVACR